MCMSRYGKVGFESVCTEFFCWPHFCGVAVLLLVQVQAEWLLFVVLFSGSLSDTSLSCQVQYEPESNMISNFALSLWILLFAIFGTIHNNSKPSQILKLVSTGREDPFIKLTLTEGPLFLSLDCNQTNPLFFLPCYWFLSYLSTSFVHIALFSSS